MRPGPVRRSSGPCNAATRSWSSGYEKGLPLPTLEDYRLRNLIFCSRDAMRRRNATAESKAIHAAQIVVWEAQLAARGLDPPTDAEFGAYLARRFGRKPRKRTYTAPAAPQEELMRALAQSVAAQVKG